MDKRVFLRAARKALYEWGREEGYEDLVNTLWVWYLESPGTVLGQHELVSVLVGFG
jgi:hypothetical protein